MDTPASAPDSILTSRNPKIIDIFEKIDQIGRADSSILLTGESGAGKDIFTQYIHSKSGRGKKPLINVNCSAIQESLLESEFFGHKKGAFTGAVSNKRGVFELADGGTLFLDEIGELPLHLQPKILRAIENGTIRPVGSEKEISVNIRLICATNRDLSEMVEEKTFRKDLFYRINVIHFKLPALRERPEDIELFINFFLDKFSRSNDKKILKVDAEFISFLKQYSFPGNIRELRNIIDHAVVFSKNGKINMNSIPELVKECSSADTTPQMNCIDTFSNEISAVLLRKNGNVTQAAKELGVHRSTIHRYLKKNNPSSN